MYGAKRSLFLTGVQMKARLSVIAVVIALSGSFLVAPPAFAGSTCRDGTWSRSEGRGTCSSHGGVAVSGVPDPAGSTSAVPAPVTPATPEPVPSVPIPSASTPSVPATGITSFASLAAAVAVADPTNTSPTGFAYKRSFFKLWTTQDGCSTREVVLIAEAVGGTRAGCSMVGATWLSPYDGVTTSNAGSFDIDHMVPLKEAWLSGAAAWTPERRTAYANDLGWAQSLIAVSARSNRQKSDRDPARWMPHSAGYACTYVEVWVGVKFRWDLSMDPAEKTVVDSILAGCPADLVPLPSKAE